MSNLRIGAATVRGLSLALAIAVAGCATSYDDNPMQGQYNREVVVSVDNQAFSDVVIYANWNSSVKRRVGMVTGKTSETFSIPWMSETVRFEADFIAGPQFYFDPAPAYTGDHFDLVVLASSERGRVPLH